MADRFSVRRSSYDTKPQDELPDLIEFTIRGPRGALKGRSVVDARLARLYWRRLGKLLGEPVPETDPAYLPGEQ